MILVAIDTSTRYAGAAVATERRTESHSWRSEQNHGRELMPAVIGLLDRIGARPADITHMVVALGPGGFSALRVGITAAIGLALPRSLPLHGVPTHEIEAYPYLERTSPSAPLYAVIPVGRGELAWARYDAAGPCSATGVSDPGALLQAVGSSAIFCGEGAHQVPVGDSPSRILGGTPPTRSPLHLVEIGLSRIREGTFGRGGPLQPIYARQPSITKPNPVA